MISRNTKGFTLVELMLAMSLFISILVISTTAFVGINRTFSKGVTRKQLSEAVQRTVEEVTRSIREGGSRPQATAVLGYGAVCNSQSCFVWKAPSIDSGLIKTISGDVENASDAYKIVDDRYKVDFIKIETLPTTNDNKLYRISGVMRTPDNDAYSFVNDDYGDYISTQDPSKISCKGTAEAGASRSCALEKFEFVVNMKEGA